MQSKPTIAAATGFSADRELCASPADSTGTVIIADVLAEVLADDALRSHEIHPNHARMADPAFQAIPAGGNS